MPRPPLLAATEMLMKPISIPLAVTLAISATGLQAADSEKGRKLHDAHCRACHEALMQGDPNLMYTRPDRQVHDRTALAKQTQRCAQNLGLGWSEENLNDVIGYLSEEFYKF